MKPEATMRVERSCGQAVEWHSDYSVHVQEIDERHYRIFTTLNELTRHLRPCPASRRLLDTLDELHRVTLEAFATEAVYFDKFGYQQTQAHQHEHEAILAQVQQCKDAVDEGGADLLSVEALQEAVVRHISDTDRQFGEFLRRNSLRTFMRAFDQLP